MNVLKLGVLSLQFLLLIVASSDLLATSYVPIQDEDLVDGTPLIAVARVQGLSPAPSERPATDYFMQIETVLKGSVPGSHLVVRVPGGVRPDGLALKVWGAPTFRPEERVLVFLVPGTEGTWSLSQLMLGAFFEVPDAGGAVAVRHLSEAHAVVIPGRSPGFGPGVRDFAAFGAWIAARSTGLRQAPGYWRTELEPFTHLVARPEAFTLFEDGTTGFNFRWPDFDGGEAVTFFAHEDGQPGVPGGGFTEFQTALAAWSAVAGALIDFQYGGTTTDTGGLTFPTDDSGNLVNAIVFDDPNSNPAFGAPFSCTAGGILAIGGPWFVSTLTHTYEGRTYVSILSGDIVTNVNAGCFLAVNEGAAEVFSHELGHTLGIGHSCGDAASGSCDDDPPGDSDALMRAQAHGDGRGASIRSDDLAAVCFLYSDGSCAGELPLFADGFESGDVTAWSSTVP